jgi:hypothetical protein
METVQLTDMDVENPGNNSIEDNSIEKVISPPPQKKKGKKYKDADIALQNSPVKEKTSGKSANRKTKKLEKMAITLAKLEEKEKKTAEKRVLLENFARDLNVLIDRSAEIKLDRKNLALLKKVLKEIKRDIKKSGTDEKIHERILKIQRKIARMNEKQSIR